MTAQWSLDDPAAVEGSELEKSFAFRKAFRELTGKPHQDLCEPPPRLAR
jgi:hypothetical protein